MKNGTNKEWQKYWAEFESAVYVFGALLFFPIIVLVGLAYGIKAGAIVTLEKVLEIMKGWKP